MKYAAKILVSIVFVLFAAGKSGAQNCYKYNNSFSTFVSTTTTSNTTGSVTVLIEGSGSMTIAPGCPKINLTYPAVAHTPKVFNYVQGRGGWTSGPAACETCYVNYQSSVEFDDPGDGVPASINPAAQMNCNVGGLFFTATGFPTSLYFAFTKVFETGTEYGCSTDAFGNIHCTVGVTPYCTAYTSPPDFAPNAIIGVRVSPNPEGPYFNTKTICVGYPNGTYACFPATLFVTDDGEDSSLGVCTKRH